MLQIFRRSQIQNYLFLLIYAVVLRVALFIIPIKVSSAKGGYLSEWLLSYLQPTEWWSHILAILLVVVQAFLINSLVANYRLFVKTNMFAGVFYILFTSLIPEFLRLSPILLANTAFIIGLYSCFGSTRKNTRVGSIFNFGIWLSISSLFYFEYIYLAIFGLVGLSILITPKLREYILFIIGLIVPFLLTGTVAYLFNSLESFLQSEFSTHFGLTGFQIPNDPFSYGKIILILGAYLLVIGSLAIYTYKQNITAQKFIRVIWMATIFAGLTVFLHRGAMIPHLLILSVPIGVCLGINFYNLRKPSLAEGLHLLLVFTVLFLQYSIFIM